MDPPFPQNRMEDLAWQAEPVLYRQLSHSDAPSWALYEAGASPECRQFFFLLCLVGVARVGIDVRGGVHRLLDVEWQLWTPTGWRTERSPLAQPLEAANWFGNVMEQRLGRRCPILPVLALPDMDRDSGITGLARVGGVRAMWGMERFAERVVELAAASGVSRTPTVMR